MAEHIFALREQYPHFASQRRRHRQVGLTHTTDANLLDGLPPGPRGLTALLLTCTQINQETTPILYGNSGFHFVSRKALNSFLLLLSASAKISIRYLRVRYEPSLTPDKLGLDTQGQQRWALTCEKLVKELKGLEGLILVVDMASNAFYHFRHGPACQSLDGWVVPWLLLRECQWRSVEILSNGTDAAAGESPAAQLRRELLGSKLRETDALAISYWYNEHGMITGKYAPRYKACKSASYSLNAENFCPFGDGQWFYKA
ncbi:hypothetical protein MMC13_000040 [Lambiella insularis]|nr:hypothetical protein [Lambiella insularis]